jgi:hypothetical protein
MKILSSRKRLATALALILPLAGLVYGQHHVTRFEVKSGSNTRSIDIVHGMPAFDFQGEKPVLKVVSGDKQPKVSGYLPQPLLLGVFHADGVTPWPSAPVTLSVEYGKGGWASQPGGTVSASLTVTADTSGIAQAYYWMP